MADLSRENEQDPGHLVIDEELNTYRNLLDQPTSFSHGFGWTTVVGAVFCGLCMFPGAIYLGLLSGLGMGSAAQWVTVIIFSEITRRSLKAMSRQEMVVLLMVAGAMIGGTAMMPRGGRAMPLIAATGLAVPDRTNVLALGLGHAHRVPPVHVGHEFH